MLTDEQFNALLGRVGVGNTGANTTGDNAGGSSKSVKPVRPSVDIDTTESDWAVFLDDWKRFKRMAKLTAIVDTRDNLRQCCATQLNKMLFDVKGADILDSATEEDLIGWIKAIAVKGVHKEVHRTTFVSIQQKQGEGGNAYYSRLKSASSLCDFRVAAPSACADDNCTCAHHGMQISYQDDMVATQLVAGLYSNEHKSKILSDSATLTKLDDKLEKLLVLEKSDISMSSLGGTDAFANYTYGRNDHEKGIKDIDKRKREKVTQRRRWEKADANSKCPDCKKKHPQCATCKGYHKCTTKCNFCKDMGHIKNCCPKYVSSLIAAAANTNAGEDDDEGVAFNYSCSVVQKVMCNDITYNTFSVSVHQISTYLLTHMECKDESFLAAKPAKAPLIRVTCTLIVPFHSLYGRHLPDEMRRPKSVKTEGLADTGAQVCTAGPNLLSRFNVDPSFLIPTKLEVKGITHYPVTMLGALFLEVSSTGMRTRQIVYIAREARSLILSETALKHLGVIPANFPTAGSFDGMPLKMIREVEHMDTNQSAAGNQSSKTLQADVAFRTLVKNSCGCFLRTEVPPLPTKIPCDKPEMNRALLQQWILEYYKTSAFNICPHQLIPTITGPDMVIVTE